VLVGYGVLLLANRQLAALSRYDAHSDGVYALQKKLTESAEIPDSTEMQRRISSMLLPGVTVWLEGAPGAAETLGPLESTASRLARQVDGPVSFREGGGIFLTYANPVLLSSGPARLHVLEDFSADAGRERITQLLLIAMAGMTALLTSALLRLVMEGGLRPLQRLGNSVAAISADGLGRQRLQEQPQPEELQPIALAFDDLLDRLAISFERQRDFVDGVSHELRTSMTLISGYAQRLQRQAEQTSSTRERDPASDVDSDGAAAEMIAPLALIQGEAERVGRLVSDLLAIARDEAGHLEVSHQVIDVELLLLATYEQLVDHAGSRLRLLAPVEAEVLVACGDADRLQQCLTNLVENALKYADPGSPIELFATSQCTPKTTPQASGESLACSAEVVVVHVRDRGPGVADAEKERIFERFVQGSASSRRRGSGIGLSVVKLLMERMGGEARVVDAPGPGGGSDFQLLLRRFSSKDPLP